MKIPLFLPLFGLSKILQIFGHCKDNSYPMGLQCFGVKIVSAKCHSVFKNDENSMRGLSAKDIVP